MQTLDDIGTVTGIALFVGPADRGKTTLLEAVARATVAHRRLGVLDLDPGQSEIGPPGLLDLAEAEAGKPMGQWRARKRWYLGDTSPYTLPMQAAVGASRLAAMGRELGFELLLADTASFLPTPAGHALATAWMDVLQPAAVVAVSQGEEMEAWLRTVSAPIVRVASEAAARVKPSGLRAVRRASRLAAYFQASTDHAVRLDEWPLRGTRFGLAPALPAAERAAAATALGCPVVHAERAGTSAALWTLGPPRHPPERAAAALGARRVACYDAAWWNHRSVGFIQADGSCLAMGLVLAVDWPSLTATIRAPIYSVAEASVLSAGRMRHKPDGESLPPVPENMI
jgi:polynucleotide 5'-kinase involved in rRNA processing